MSFSDLGLNEKTIQAITDLGYEKPTTVQKDVIPSILEGKDIFTIAPSACGKTCAYIFPLIDIISKNNTQNILIITADEKESVNVSDKFAIFNKYHQINDEDTSGANVIIASPSLLLDNIKENNIDVSNINILVVDDINLIKKNHQLANFEKILELLPAEKQNIVFTTRRSKETQDTLNKILKTPAEIKIDKNKESEVTEVNQNEPIMPSNEEKPKKEKRSRYQKRVQNQDKKAMDLARRYKIFGKKTPSFLLDDTTLVTIAD
jgi:superfamily II DNA/RNA helicase